MPMTAHELGLFEAMRKTPSGTIEINQPHSKVGRRRAGNSR